MRIGLSFLLSFLTTAAAWSQSSLPSDSFEATYKQTNPILVYEYDSLRQIHNYSSNWDLDQDGKLDQVYFVGTGGAHLYYFLRVILSTDMLVRDFPFIQSDFPVLPPDGELCKTSFNPGNGWTQFAVFDCEEDKAIFIRLDSITFDAAKKSLKKKGIKTNLVILTFKNGKSIFKDFSNSNKAH